MATSGDGAGGAGGEDWRAELKKITKTQQILLTKVNNNHTEIKTLISQETKKVKEDIFLELAQITSRLKVIASLSPARSATTREPFDPQVTIGMANMPLLAREEGDTDLWAKVEHIVQQGMELPGVEIVDVKRLSGRGSSPGIVLIECCDVDDKITILRAKQNLRANHEYKELYLRWAEWHSHRLIRHNFQTLLNHLGIQQQFRISGSGRLVKRDGDGQRQGSRDRPGKSGDHAPRSNDSRAAPPSQESATGSISGSERPNSEA